MKDFSDLLNEIILVALSIVLREGFEKYTRRTRVRIDNAAFRAT